MHVTMTGKTKVVVLAIGAAWMSGCGVAPPGDAPVASQRPIQGGDNDDSHLFAVGILAQLSRGVALCSGALLAPNLVATARHCVAALPANGIVCPDSQFGGLTPATRLAVTTDSDVRTGSTRYAVSQIIVPPGADQTSVCGNDIALLILSQNVALPAYVTPAINPPMTDHGVYSTVVTDIGYGESMAMDTTGVTTGIRRIKQDVELACIPNDRGFTDCFPSLASQMTASEFLSGNGTCEGDSGSSAFEQVNFDAGKWLSFGVVSRGSTSGATCVGGIYSRFDAWSALIIDAAMQAATKGGYALPAWAKQDGGAADAGGDSSSLAEVDASSDSMAGSTPGDGGSGDRGETMPPDSGCSCASGRTGAPARSRWSDALSGLAMALVLSSRRRRPSRRAP